MSSPPLNEDKWHGIRTPNVNVGQGLGFANPGAWKIRYSADENREATEEEVLAVTEATFKGHVTR